MKSPIPGVAEIVSPTFPAGTRVFMADLEALPTPPSLLSALDPSSRARADAFAAAHARDSFVRRRWLRYALLAREFDIDPRSISIESDRLGRPTIVAPNALRSVHLSTSSAGPVAIVGWCPDRSLGVDIARVDPTHASPEAAAVFMSPDERADWNPADSLAFFRIWARKEAALKAIGTGFATDPPTVNASGPILASRGARIERVIDIHDIETCPGHVAAIAFARIQRSPNQTL